MIIWLTGNSGSGKTTLGKLLALKLNAIFLDGDDIRSSFSSDLGFTKEDREQNNIKTALFADKLHNQQRHIVVAMIAPFESTRKKISKLIVPIWIYVKRPSLPCDKDKPYEPPTNSLCEVDNDANTIMENLDIIMKTVETLL